MVGVYGVLHFYDFDVDILLSESKSEGLVDLLKIDRLGLCGSHALPLVIHVPLLRFLQLREVHVYIFDSDQWPPDEVALADCFEPSCFSRKTAACVDDSNTLLN